MRYITCFGDSLIQGFPFGSSSSWISYAGADGSLQLLNYGVCGDCCDDIYYRMSRTALPEQIRHVLFLGGANDLLQGRPLAVILEDIGKAVAWCEKNKLTMCIVLPFISGDKALNGRINPLREAIKAAYKQKLLLLDLQPAIGTTEAELQEAYLDGVHPKAAVHRAMGVYAGPLLQEWINK